MPKANDFTGEQRDGLLTTLRARFEAHMHRHARLQWTTVLTRLESHSAKLWSLKEMEQSGGEPDVVGIDKSTGETIFVDCSAQSPTGRRSVCYDRASRQTVLGGESLDELLHQVPSVPREPAQAALGPARETLEALVAA